MDRLSVERMLACGTCAIGVHCYCCISPHCTHSRFFYQSCKSKACSSCGLKASKQWIATQQHLLRNSDWLHITLPSPCALAFFNNNWPLLNGLFRSAPRAMLRFARKMGIESDIFCALHRVWRSLFFKKKNVGHIWRIAATRLLLGFAALMKGFLGTDPYQCILCGDRLRFAGATRDAYHEITVRKTSADRKNDGCKQEQ